MIKRLSFILIVCLLNELWGCTNIPDKSIVQIITPDTTHTGIDYGYLATKLTRQRLNLKDLEQGIDSFELRIYEDFTLGTPDKVFIIKKEGQTWSSTVMYYWERITIHDSAINSLEDIINNINIDSTKTYLKQPQCGWKSFIDTLSLLSPFNMVSQTEISNFRDRVNDGTNFRFEVATAKKYKYFSYHCPDFYTDTNNRKATELLQFIGRQIYPVRLCDWNNY